MVLRRDGGVLWDMDVSAAMLMGCSLQTRIEDTAVRVIYPGEG